MPNRASENIFAISSGDHRTSSAPPPDPVELEGQRIAKAVQAQRPDKVSAIETPLVALIFDFSKGWWGEGEIKFYIDGDKEFRFISWNIPNLLIVEDNLAWRAPSDWVLPDEFELTDAFASDCSVRISRST